MTLYLSSVSQLGKVCHFDIYGLFIVLSGCKKELSIQEGGKIGGRGREIDIMFVEKQINYRILKLFFYIPDLNSIFSPP